MDVQDLDVPNLVPKILTSRTLTFRFGRADLVRSDLGRCVRIWVTPPRLDGWTAGRLDGKSARD